MPRKNKSSNRENDIDSNESEVREFAHARQVICERLERFETFLNSKIDDIFQVEIRLKSIEEDFSEFDKIQTRLEYFQPEEKEHRLDTESAFYSLISSAKRLIVNHQKSEIQLAQTQGHTRTGESVTHQSVLGRDPGVVAKLPELGLPTFHGKYETWYSFRDIFNSLVHIRTDLTEIDKFLYLKICCKDDALNLIESLDVTADNYSIAFELLRKRYENPKAIINFHVHNILFNLPNVVKESPVHIRKLLDTVHQHLSALTKLNLPVTHWDTFIIPLILQKLDDGTKRDWENKNSNNQNLPKLQDLIEFLSNKCLTLEAINTKHVSNYANKSNLNDKTYTKHQQSNAYLNPCKVSFPVTTEGNNSCCICNQNHLIFQCPSFANLHLSDKYNEIRKHKLCSNCLRSGHMKSDCRSSGCKKCNAKHNTALHVENHYNKNNYSQNQSQKYQRGQNNYQSQSSGNAASYGRQSANVTHVSSHSQHQQSQGGTGTQFNESRNNRPHCDNPNNSRNPSNARPTMLTTNQNTRSNLENDRENVNNSNNSQNVTYSYTNISDIQVLLSIATIFIRDSFGNWIKCNALLDSGSQSNLISEYLCKKLNLKCYKINSIPLVGINQTETQINYRTDTKIKSQFGNFERNVSFLILPLPYVTEKLPIIGFDRALIKCMPNVDLADDNFNCPKPIDLILGGEIYYDLLKSGKIKLGPGLPVLQETYLGWLVVGAFNLNQNSNKTICNFSKISNKTLNDSLTKFWELEEFENKPILSEKEKFCEEYFKKTTTRSINGRFIVKYPFNVDIETKLGNSKTIALKRFKNLESRLSRDENLKTQYVQFMREYKDLGHMTLIGNLIDDYSEDAESYFLPHTAVLRDSAVTTKCRVVFDGSCKTSNGLSLNDLLLVGPTIQSELFEILLRLRLRKIVICADVKMMYRCIDIDENERKFQKILWRENANDEIQVYNLKTVTYGTASAPWQAVRCLKELSILYKNKYPETCKILENSFFMDDLCISVDSEQEAIKLFHELTEILGGATFELRKWSSNNINILNYIDNNNTTNSVENYVMYHDHKDFKTLGIIWDANEDILKFKINITYNKNKITKRTVLSTVSQIYDPLGLIGPAVIRAKLIIQQLWHLKLDWDIEIPKNLQEIWLELMSEINVLNQLQIKRHASIKNSQKLELYGFCDSSEKAYGACIYLATYDSQGNKHIHLLTAKSRVAPLRKETVARLELLSAHLLAKLVLKIKNTLNITISKTIYFTDSTIVLSWLKIEPFKLKTFVANRVSKIMEITKLHEWRHVRSKNNPADMISRGLKPTELLNNEVWFHGPEFLKNDSFLSDFEEKNNTCNILKIENLPEIKQNTLTLSGISENSENTKFEKINFFNRCSKLGKLKRVIAYILRFKTRTLNKRHAISKNLSSEEINNAFIILIKIAQHETFKQEILELEKSKELSSNSKLLNLRPFLDKNKILRVGGRLVNAQISYEQQHPIILAQKHKFTEMIVLNEHIKNLHAGNQTLLSIVRLRFWPIQGKNVVKKVIRTCVRCFRAKPKIGEFLMGNLPRDRVVPSRPFSSIGLDYAGPILVKENTSRRSRLVKTYFCIFICFSTHAIHIELAPDMTTGSFLNVLKRFCARRGKPKTIHSDNGLNFVGANNHFIELYNMLNDEEHLNVVNNFLASDNISWRFIPARSPHMGGYWESAVRLTKFHLKRVLGNATLSYEEMYTLLVEIEAILNSRPLTPLSHDPNDYLPLCPSHFLIGDSLLLPPEEDVRHENTTRLNRFQRLKQLSQQFWDRWSREYLASLQTRSKWKKNPSFEVNIDSLVVLVEENLPPLRWPMARIIATHPGADNIVRVVSVRLPNGTVTKRSVKRICVLPID